MVCSYFTSSNDIECDSLCLYSTATSDESRSASWLPSRSPRSRPPRAPRPRTRARPQLAEGEPRTPEARAREDDDEEEEDAEGKLSARACFFRAVGLIDEVEPLLFAATLFILGIAFVFLLSFRPGRASCCWSSSESSYSCSCSSSATACFSSISSLSSASSLPLFFLCFARTSSSRRRGSANPAEA